MIAAIPDPERRRQNIRTTQVILTIALLAKKIMHGTSIIPNLYLSNYEVNPSNRN